MRSTVTAVRLGRLGDLVMTLPALAWLGSSDQIDLSLVCDEHYRELMGELLPTVRVVAAQRLDELPAADAIVDLHLVASSARVCRDLALRAGGFRVRVDKQWLLRATLVQRAPWLRGPQRALASFLGGQRSLLSWPQRHLLAAEHLFSTLDLQPPPRPSSLPAVALDSPVRRAHGRDSVPVLGLVLDAGWDLKRWRRAGFMDLAKGWRAACGGAIKLFAAPSRSELFEGFAALAGVQACAAPSPLLLARDLAACDVVVAGDTGPLHLAAAVGCSVVGLFGPTPVAAGFWVWQDRGRLLSGAADCSPCSMHGASDCHRPRRICLDDIEADEVLRASLQLLHQDRQCA